MVVNFKDDTNFQPFHNIVRVDGTTGTSTNMLTINNVQTIKDIANPNAFLINLSTTGKAFTVSELATGLGTTSSGLPKLYVRNSTVYLEADIQVQDFTQIQSGTTVLFTIPPLMRPTSTRRIIGYVGQVSSGTVNNIYNVIIEINTNGQVRMIGRPETNDINMLEIFGSYTLS